MVPAATATAKPPSSSAKARKYVGGRRRAARCRRSDSGSWPSATAPTSRAHDHRRMSAGGSPIARRSACRIAPGPRPSPNLHGSGRDAREPVPRRERHDSGSRHAAAVAYRTGRGPQMPSHSIDWATTAMAPRLSPTTSPGSALPPRPSAIAIPGAERTTGQDERQPHGMQARRRHQQGRGDACDTQAPVAARQGGPMQSRSAIAATSKRAGVRGLLKHRRRSRAGRHDDPSYEPDGRGARLGVRRQQQARNGALNRYSTGPTSMPTRSSLVRWRGIPARLADVLARAGIAQVAHSGGDGADEIAASRTRDRLLAEHRAEADAIAVDLAAQTSRRRPGCSCQTIALGS